MYYVELCNLSERMLELLHDLYIQGDITEEEYKKQTEVKKNLLNSMKELA